jgi:hypothetical protein
VSAIPSPAGLRLRKRRRLHVVTVAAQALAVPTLVRDGEHGPTLAPGRVQFERVVLTQHGLLESLQRLARLQAELANQVVARVAIGRERVRLSSGAVEREHELAAKALAQRVASDESLELGDQQIVPAEREIRIDAVLERREPAFLEPLDIDARERLEGEIRERRPAPERQRLAQLVHGALGRAGRKRAPTVLGKPLEPVEIELAEADAQHVAGRTGHKHVVRDSRRAEGPAETRDVRLQRVGRARRRLLAPELVDQHVGADGLICSQEQDGEHGTLLATAERHLLALV